MKFNFTHFLIVSMFAVFMQSASAKTAIDDPIASQTFVQDLANRTFAVLDRKDLTSLERHNEFRRLLAEGFQIDHIAKLVLGSHRRLASVQQLQEFDSLFPEFIINIYSDQLSQYSSEDFVITGTIPAGKYDIYVISEISPKKAASFRADWRVRTFDDNPRIIDVKIDGISLLQTQRDDFSARISRSGFDALLSDMRKQNDSYTVQ